MNRIKEARNPMSGSQKSSYQNWNSARLIVRHTKPVNEEIVGARSRNIQKIFIETAEGERFKFPVNHLAGARAMARHMGVGGTFHDKTGSHIINMSEEFKHLQKINHHIFANRTTLEPVAFNLREAIQNRLNNIRADLGTFMTIRGYSYRVDELANAPETNTLVEQDISESISALRNILKLEENSELDSALSTAIPLLSEMPAEDSRANHLATVIQKVYGEGDTDLGAFASAGALLANPSKIEFVGAPSTEDKPVDSVAGVAHRLGAIAARLKPSTDAQLILSNALSRIVDKIEHGLQLGGKVSITPAEKEFVTIFLRDVAPVIGESTNKTHDEETYPEAAELREWFSKFDPVKFAKEEKKVTENKLFDVITGDDAWQLANFLVKGKISPRIVAECYTNSDKIFVAAMLHENWTTETTEAIIKGLEIDEDNMGSKDELKEYWRSPTDNTFLWFNDANSLKRALELLDQYGIEDFKTIDDNMDYGIEFVGPRIRDAMKTRFANEPNIDMTEKPLNVHSKTFPTRSNFYDLNADRKHSKSLGMKHESADFEKDIEKKDEEGEIAKAKASIKGRDYF